MTDTVGEEMRILINRPTYNQQQFDAEFGRNTTPPKSVREKLRSLCCGDGAEAAEADDDDDGRQAGRDLRRRHGGGAACAAFWRSLPFRVLRALYDTVPIVETLRTYKWRTDILRDLMAGISVGMVHIPQGMGFALLAAVAPVYGLYASFWQVLLYMLLGRCRHLSIGTMAVISLIIGAVVERETALWRESGAASAAAVGNFSSTLSPLTTLSASPSPMSILDSSTTVNTETQPSSTVPTTPSCVPMEVEGLTEEDRFRASVANGVSLVAGATMLGMGLLKLGVLTTFMPTSFISGFTTAAAFHIVTTQLKAFFNLKVKRHGGIYNLPLSLYEILRSLPETSIPDLIISLTCITFLIFIKEFINVRFKDKMKIPVPADMIVVIVATLVSYLASFQERFCVKIVGFIPRGIPEPEVPNLSRASTYIVEGMVAGVTSFAISISMVNIFTTKHRYQADPNRELVAYGLTYGVSSFLHCFVGAAAPPRCFVMEFTGGKTQVASFFTAILLLLVLLVIGPLFKFLPNAVLSCIIIVALFPLFKQFRILPTLWRLSKPDLVVWIITFIVSVVFDVSVSLGVGMVVAIFATSLPSMCARGYSYGRANAYDDLYAPVRTHADVRSRPDVVVFRYECTLYYLTLKSFKRQLFAAAVDPTTLPPPPDDNTAIAVSSASTSVASSSAEEAEEGNDLQSMQVKSEARPTNGTPVAATTRTNDENASATKGSGITGIILDCAPIGFVDLMGLNLLKSLHDDYKAMGIDFVLANVNPALRLKLEKVGLLSADQAASILIFPTVQDAMASYNSHDDDASMTKL